MADMLLKPYELSVWEEELDKSGEYYKENKIAVIASSTLDTPEAAHSLVLHKNVNGETTLTFSIQYRYFDPMSEEMVVNPFAQYLVNERKVKLKYDDQWYDFIIRNHVETTDGMTWNITAEDAFVLELSKNGYSVELNTELNNNLGTAAELAEEVLKGTDWKVRSDTLIQLIEEPLWTVTTTAAFNAKQISGDDAGETVSIGNDGSETLYVFYSYIINREEKFLQFIRESDRDKFTFDDNGVITAPNYRLEQDVSYNNQQGIATQILLNGSPIMNIGPIYTEHHGYRLVYNQLVKYDPVASKLVDLYHVDYDDGERQEIYHYNNYDYTTSNVVMSYITNGDNFSVYENGSLQGWESSVTDNEQLIPLNLTTYPKVDQNVKLSTLTNYAQIRGFLETKFNGKLVQPTGDASYKNAIFNSGIEDNAQLVKYIGRGQDYVLRLRYGYSTEQNGTLIPATASNGLRAMVAKYNTVEFTAADGNTYWLKEIDKFGVILDFTGGFTEQNNYINTGTFNQDHTAYYINGVACEPSTQYCYQEEGTTTSYIWDAEHREYVLKDGSAPAAQSFLNYYYTVGKATKSISNKELSDPTTKIGIFLYIDDDNLVDKYIYLEDVQLTPYLTDANNNIVTIGNIPTAAVSTSDCFYLKPKENADTADLEIFNSKADLARNLGISEDLIQPTYNEASEKILTVEESHSNCFNILQTIAETFECWVRLEAEHDDKGALILDDNHKPQKYVVLNEFAGKENFAGFKYGINLQSIERTIDSAEVVTKLIVDPIQSEYVDNGIVTIQDADANPSGESYILNLDYFCKQGLIKNQEDCINDLSNFYAQIKAQNILLNEEEQKRINLEAALVEINSRRNVYVNLIDEAKEDYNKTLVEFQEATGMSYDDYVQNAESIAIESGDPTDVTSWLKIDTIVELVTKIYQDAVIVNNYSGLAYNLESEYKKLRTQCYGTEDYGLTISRTRADVPSIAGTWVENVTVNLSDYVVPFVCAFYTANDTQREIHVASLNEKNFEITTDMPGGAPCTKVKIFNIPPDYQLKYGDQLIPSSQITENTPVVIDLDIGSFKNYKLVPVVEQQGCVDRIKELEEQKKDIESDFYSKYSRFIQEGQWSSQDYIDSNLYYLDALQVSRNYAEPQVSYSINVVDVSELEDLQNYVFEIGDKTYIEDTEFFGWIKNENGIVKPAKEEVIISELEWHLDNPVDNIITVQNYRTEFKDLFQRLNATVQTVQYNENSYAKTTSILNAGGTINQQLLLSSLNNISGREYNLTSDGTIITDSEGILIRDLTNPQNLMRLSSGGLKISNDAGATWRTAVDGQGINIGTVYTGVLNTQQILIQDGNAPSFRWDKSGLSAFKQNENPAEGEPDYDLRKYVRLDQYGLYGVDGSTSADYTMRSLQDVKNKAQFGLTWDGFFIKSSYTNGYVSISSNNDFQVMRTEGTGDQKREYERIKIGALEWMIKTTDQQVDDTKTYYKIEGGNYVVVSSPVDSELGQYYEKTTTPQADTEPTLYGIRIKNDAGEEVMKTDSEGNLRIVGTIDALAANFSQMVTVGKNDTSTPNWIEIDGVNSLIQTSDYNSGGRGWMINKDGDAVFNNIVARGSIKTAVFEYAEIQAVGGVFLFRPSSTIRSAAVDGQNLIVTVEKPALFNNGDWCKVSNYTTDGSEPDPTSQITNNGLTHVYQISRTAGNNNITLIGAAAMVDETNGVTSLQELEGGALVNMGDTNQNSNYGIGINSSDNTVNLPARSISLFETTINTDPQSTIKVTYDYKDVLGTLPELDHRTSEQDTSSHKVSYLYHQYFEGTQGLYTDNMYIGNDEYYLAYYTTNNNVKHLRIEAGNLKVNDTGAYINGTVEAKTGKIGEFILDNPGSTGYANRLYTTGYLPFNNISSNYYNNTSTTLNGIYISTSTPMVDLTPEGNYFAKENFYDASDNIHTTDTNVYPKGDTALENDWLYSYDLTSEEYTVITPSGGIGYEIQEAWRVNGDIVYPKGTVFKWVSTDNSYVKLDHVVKHGIIPQNLNSYGVIAGGNLTQMNLTKKEIESDITEGGYAPAWYFRSDGEARIGSIRLSNTGEISMPTLSSMTVDLGVMESGVIKHDPVGYENGLWLSAAENIKAEYVKNPPDSTIDYEHQYENDEGIRIGDSIYRNDWRLILSNQFGITKEGQLYAADASIQNLALNKDMKVMLTTDTLNVATIETVATDTFSDQNCWEGTFNYNQQITNNSIKVTLVDSGDGRNYVLGRRIENETIPVYTTFVNTKSIITTGQDSDYVGEIGLGDDGSAIGFVPINVTFDGNTENYGPILLSNNQYNYGAPMTSAVDATPLVFDWTVAPFAILVATDGTMFLHTPAAGTYSIKIEAPQRTYMNDTITTIEQKFYTDFLNQTNVYTYSYSNPSRNYGSVYTNKVLNSDKIRVTFEGQTYECTKQALSSLYYYGAPMNYNNNTPYVYDWTTYPFALLIRNNYIYVYTQSSYKYYSVKVETITTYGLLEDYTTQYDRLSSETLKVTFNGTDYNCRLMSTTEAGTTYGDTTFTEMPFYIISKQNQVSIYTKLAGTYTMKVQTPTDSYVTKTYQNYVYGATYETDPSTGLIVYHWTECPFFIRSNYQGVNKIYTERSTSHTYRVEVLVPDPDEDDDQSFIETIRRLEWDDCLETDEQILKNVTYIRTYLILKPYLKRVIRWG